MSVVTAWRERETTSAGSLATPSRLILSVAGRGEERSCPWSMFALVVLVLVVVVVVFQSGVGEDVVEEGGGHGHGKEEGDEAP